MATTPTRLITVAEYDEIPNPPEGVYELYHGELVKVGFPKSQHLKGQLQLRRLLENAVAGAGVVKEKMPFRPLLEYECWAADVAMVSQMRWDSMDDWLMGAPELVVEILSPSNSLPKLLDKGRICLQNAALEFWIVDLRRREVRVPHCAMRPYIARAKPFPCSSVARSRRTKSSSDQCIWVWWQFAGYALKG